ncbi:GNAT family N-acetyltransferase [Anaerobacillus sp. MEB173]|uniref:GNAT family N-acetyltransferase n=1 Tax=Anaerobacillus sp. MEB173 TaxID=3383345 RepID=UPI003F915EA5
MSYTIITNQREILKILQKLHFHSNLNRFRDSDKQQEAMLIAMESDDVLMALALNNENIIGYAIILSPESDERWIRLNYLKMLGVIEVAPEFRNQKVGQKLLQALFRLAETENYIIISLEYCWHWDLDMTNGDPILYKNMLKHVLESVGFEEFHTNEPDIACYDVNFMMARVGSKITLSQLYDFANLAIQSNVDL